MRIASLARKIKLSPSKISAYAESIGVDMSRGSNSKLSEEQIEQILEHFNASLPVEQPETLEAETLVDQPERKETVTEPLSVDSEEIVTEETESNIEEPELIEEETVEETPEPQVSNEQSTEIETTDTPISETVSNETPEEVTDEPVLTIDETTLAPDHENNEEEELSYAEQLALDKNTSVITPKKVQLQGLTVKGKINLPEPKPKVEETSPEEKETEKVKEAPVSPDGIRYTTGPDRRRKKPQNKKYKKKRKEENPVEAARQKQKLEEERKERQRQKRVKQQKTEHYQNQVSDKQLAIKKPKKKTKKPVETKTSLPPTNNVFKKFWRWMNT